MDQQIATGAYLVLFAVSSLVLISLGLAVVFGLMRVINLAHGEFIMLGAYCCVFAVKAGLPLWAAFAVAALAVGLFGVIVERLIIRHLYGRLVDTLLATWGLSLFIVGAVTTLLGPQGQGIATDFGNITVGSLNLSVYNLILSAIAFGMLAATWVLARYTRFGLLVRGTMQNAAVASTMGVNPGRVYMITFGFGSALAGLAGRDPFEIARRGVGIKNQVPDVMNGLTVRENLWLAAHARKGARSETKIVDELAERVGIGGILDRLVGELAHGQRQWVEIASVIATDPRLILLDEPAAGMTDEETVKTAELIRELNRHATIVVVEHDMQFIQRIARRVTVFHQGRVLVEGSFDQVVSDPVVRDVYLGMDH